jgi:hypothetical protein
MARNHRRVGVMAAGALLAAPLIALLASPLASADPADPAVVVGGDVTTTTTTLFGFTEAFSSNSDTGGADSLLSLGSDDLDIFDNPPDTYGFLFTDGNVAQFGIEVVDGDLQFIDNVPPTTFLFDDPGFDFIGGAGVF